MVIVLIKNFKELACTKIRRDLLTIIEAGIDSVIPENLMNEKIKYYPEQDVLKIGKFNIDLSQGRLFVIGAGKAAGRMALALENILSPEKIIDGYVICNSEIFKPKTIELIIAGHPNPDGRSIAGVKKIFELKDKYSITEKDTILCLLSGGGSALLCSPIPEIKLEDIQKTNKLLLASGANIQEINAVRKHLSISTGGRLGAYFAPTLVFSVIISDIIGNPLDAIASGPTAPDNTWFKDAHYVLERFGLLDQVPSSVKDYIRNNLHIEEHETPKKLDNCKNFIIGDNQIAASAMIKSAKALGYLPLIISTEVSGEPGFEARKRAHYIKIGKYIDYDALILAGETTPVVPEVHGFGGRNQHYAAASMLELKDVDYYWALASVSSDGADYLADTAGSIIDHNSYTIASEKGLDIKQFLDKYDSNSLFNALDNSLIITGNTGTNVGDLIVYLLKKQQNNNTQPPMHHAGGF